MLLVALQTNSQPLPDRKLRLSRIQPVDIVQTTKDDDDDDGINPYPANVENMLSS
jgi:hypothetical protein